MLQIYTPTMFLQHCNIAMFTINYNVITIICAVGEMSNNCYRFARIYDVQIIRLLPLYLFFTHFIRLF